VIHGSDRILSFVRRSPLETEPKWSKGINSIAVTSLPYFVTNADKMRVEMDDPYLYA